MLQSFHRRKKSKSYPVLSLCRRRLKKDRQYGRKCNAKRIELAIKKVIRCLKKGGEKKAKIGDKNKRKSDIYRDRFQRIVKRFIKRRDYTRFRAQLINSRSNPRHSVHFVLCLRTNRKKLKYLQRSVCSVQIFTPTPFFIAIY